MTTAASSPPTRGGRPSIGDAAAVGLAGAWVVVLGRLLRHRIFLSSDTMISYAHVWYVSDRLWHHGRLPLRMPVLGHGQAFAFPYGFIPWFTAALFRPLAGDWIVTLWFVLGAVGVIVTTFVAFPELRRGWWAAAVLLDPALLQAPVLGQLPFMWAASMLLGAIACWRRDRRTAATVLAGLAQLTHPAVLGPMTAALVVGLLVDGRDRADVLRRYAVSLLIALPGAVIVWRSPVFTDSSLGVKVANLVSTVGARALIVAVPLALLALRRRDDRATVAAAACAVLVAMSAALWVPLGMTAGWAGLSRYPDRSMDAFLHSSALVPGRTYRLLRTSDRKLGLYQLLRHGGRSDAEFFPESQLFQSFPSTTAYSDVLRRRHVDVVMIWTTGERRHTNELALLEELAAHPPPDCAGPLVCVHPDQRTRDYAVFLVDRG